MKIVTKDEKQFHKAHEYDAGYDIVSCDTKIIWPFRKVVVSTGLKVAIPAHCAGIIKSRSGLAVKHNIEVGAGVIDFGYTGEVKVVLRNFGWWPYKVRKGDKVAQLILFPISWYPIMRVDSLEDSERGESGFGDSGK